MMMMKTNKYPGYHFSTRGLFLFFSEVSKCESLKPLYRETVLVHMACLNTASLCLLKE